MPPLKRRGRRVRPRWMFQLGAGLGLVAGLIAIVGLVAVLTGRVGPKPMTLGYSELLVSLQAGQVDSVQVSPGREIRGWFTDARAGAASKRFRVVYSTEDVDPLLGAAAAAGVGISFEPEPADYEAVFATVVSVTFLLLMGLLLRRQFASASVDTEAGETSGAVLSFEDVAGNTGALSDLREIVAFLQEPERFAAMGARIPKGILMEGPPGTGKTLMARALAGEAGVPCFTASGSDFTGIFVGQGVARLKALFRKARKAGGAVIFIDEIDTLGGRRGRAHGHAEDDRTLNQFLVELDGFDPSVGVVVVGATNRACDLDPALLRKGRFDRSVTIGLPTVSEREQILALHIRDRRVPLAADVDLTRLARLMTGASGAELAGLINEAAIMAVRAGSSEVTWAHVEEARDRVLLGRAREGLTVCETERRLVAVHEAGHALAGVVFCPADPLHKVTIQPRGGAMGVAFFQPDHETHIASRQYLEGQILKGLGGRAAEEIVYGTGKITSGAGSDLQHTTRVAKQMVYRLGMGASTGLITYDPDSGPVSSETHSRMDQDVRLILESSYTTVLGCLRAHRAALEALADALMIEETLSGEDAIRIMEEAGLARELAAAG
ncbi:MAG: ATP-dependent zinc metalloprotease FtsH [Gemmatimonadales bacterium]|nr:ATP-dependent zinc metalloprotease FtsH [Gemmatimonadales bacterium]